MLQLLLDAQILESKGKFGVEKNGDANGDEDQENVEMKPNSNAILKNKLGKVSHFPYFRVLFQDMPQLLFFKMANSVNRAILIRLFKILIRLIVVITPLMELLS